MEASEQDEFKIYVAKTGQTLNLMSGPLRTEIDTHIIRPRIGAIYSLRSVADRERIMAFINSPEIWQDIASVAADSYNSGRVIIAQLTSDRASRVAALRFVTEQPLMWFKALCENLSDRQPWQSPEGREIAQQVISLISRYEKATREALDDAIPADLRKEVVSQVEFAEAMIVAGRTLDYVIPQFLHDSLLDVSGLAALTEPLVEHREALAKAAFRGAAQGRPLSDMRDVLVTVIENLDSLVRSCSENLEHWTSTLEYASGNGADVDWWTDFHTSLNNTRVYVEAAFDQLHRLDLVGTMCPSRASWPKLTDLASAESLLESIDSLLATCDARGAASDEVTPVPEDAEMATVEEIVGESGLEGILGRMEMSD